MKEIDELEGRELDAAVAERVMGWTKKRPMEFADGMVSGVNTPLGVREFWQAISKPDLVCGVPYYSAGTGFQVEDRIEELGLQVQYVQALATECGVTLLANVKEYWIMLRATPEQRCRAALKASEKGENDGKES